jgi:hypothetical protein
VLHRVAGPARVPGAEVGLARHRVGAAAAGGAAGTLTAASDLPPAAATSVRWQGEAGAGYGGEGPGLLVTGISALGSMAG